MNGKVSMMKGIMLIAALVAGVSGIARADDSSTNPGIGDFSRGAAAHAATLPGATSESLPQRFYLEANEANEADLMYLSDYIGLGVQQSYPEAVKWFQLAADKGDAAATNMLGVMYAQGLGLTRDNRNALKLFGQSAYLGCSSAMVNLGAVYASGRGVKHDNALAYAWLSAALAFGVPAEAHDATVYTLGMTAARLGPNQLSRAEGLARKIAVTIASRQARTPDRKSEQARLSPIV